MTRLSQAELELIPEILSFFNLGKPKQVTPIKLGIANHNYFVNAGQSEFVVKFLINQSLEAMENDVAIQQYLSNAGIDTPRYLSNDLGVKLFIQDHHRAVVSTKIAGVVPDTIDTKLAEEFGRKLAQFHVSVKLLPYENSAGLMNPVVSGIESTIFSQPLPKGVIHGDFHAGNALVDSTKQATIVAMLDFEEAGENIYIVDLALTVMGVCSKEDNVMDLGLIDGSIRGYESIRPLSAHEKAHFSAATQYAANTWIQWFQANGFYKYARNHRKRLNTFMAFEKHISFAEA
ncbi:MAG: phosphotransferase [Chloroflexota bacterium]